MSSTFLGGRTPSNLASVEEEDEEEEYVNSTNISADKSHEPTSLWPLGLSFFLFGTINNVLYVIILSAALDLVPQGTPKGIIAFCNIAPALVAKVGWPYLLKGQIRYARRLVSCCALSVLGMIVVAAFSGLYPRLLGISLASFSSGLGELTFLQLSTTYPGHVAGRAVGFFASGTGCAGILGAALWWELRSLGVREGVSISSVLPFVIPLTFYFLLPPPAKYSDLNEYEELSGSPSRRIYTAVSVTDTLDTPIAIGNTLRPEPYALTARDKWRLVKPLLLKYMAPLFCVYTFEYTINQGISPTLIYPVPSAASHPFFYAIIKSLRDYYPLWQLIYQASVFLSRSSISLGLPPLPAKSLSLPAIIQAVILLLLALESSIGLFPDSADGAVPWVTLAVAIEGICGGLAYVNVFYRLTQRTDSASEADTDTESEKAAQEREFQIGSIGFADSLGILLASLLSVPMEVGLCKAQVARGRELCRQV